MNKTEPTLIGAKEVAELLGLDIRSVHRRVERGELPTVTKMAGATGAYLFDRDVIAALAADVSQPSSDRGDAA